MEFADAVRRRRMVRAFEDRPVPADVVDRILDLAHRHPSAGNTQGTAFVVLESAEDRSRFWQRTADPAWDRERAWPALTKAPVIVLPFAHRQAYLERYSEPDKVALGRDHADAWPVPFWLVDTAFATMTLLLAATDAGLGALFHGLFHGQAEVVADIGAPAGWEPIGAVAMGWPARDRPSRSARAGRQPLAAVVHRGFWQSGASPR